MSLSVRESNKKKIREALFAEGLRLFSEKGIQHTTVNDIVQAVGIARGTFYNYFDDVQSLFEALIESINRRIQENVKENRKKADSIYAYLYSTFKSYLDFVSAPQMKEFHTKNQAAIRQSTYQSDQIRSVIQDINRDLRNDPNVNEFDQNYEFLLLSIMLVGAPPELFIATQSSTVEFTSEQLASFLAKTFHRVLVK
ncbi:MAG: TetR/AcrR family transcriptional regulator [Flavobacteriaceae bacterium]|nr:TetR/AcrR family transcriptional regulator [Flavobacteriales bacterium]MDG1272721.1 TetR/AcrR family transcriptional regulator [Flavobacteriaceae bacterium]